MNSKKTGRQIGVQRTSIARRKVRLTLVLKRMQGVDNILKR